jgi:hypothetical protein
MVINLNEHPISLVAFLAALLSINFVLCSHPCLLDVLLGREITRMRRSGQHHQLHQKRHGEAIRWLRIDYEISVKSSPASLSPASG